MTIRSSIFYASDIELKIVLQRVLQSGDRILNVVDEVSIRGDSTTFRRRGSHLSLSLRFPGMATPICQIVALRPYLFRRFIVARARVAGSGWLGRVWVLPPFLFSHDIRLFLPLSFFIYFDSFYRLARPHASQPIPKTEQFWRHSIYFVQSDDLNCSIGIWMRVKRLFLPATRTLEAGKFPSALPLYSLKIN